MTMRTDMDLIRRLIAAAGLGVALSGANAQLLITDGFGDGDRDNDGVPEGIVSDSSDVGVRWYSMDVFSNPEDGFKPIFAVMQDPSMDGNALYVEQGGANSEAAAFFDGPVSLGENVGDRLILSFDMRYDPLPEEDETLRPSDFRFGLYDADEELSPGGYGYMDGHWDDQYPGAVLDHGIRFEIPIGVASGEARIREELNGDGILAGSDADYLAGTGVPFGGINDAMVHTITVTLERVEEVDGDSVAITLDLDDGASVLTYTPPDSTEIYDTPTTFDYFAATNRIDINWVIDNLRITDGTVDEGCPADWDGDTDADVQDLLAYLGDFRNGNANMDDDGDTDVQDLLAFLTEFRNGC